MSEFFLKIAIGSTLILLVPFVLERFFKRSMPKTRHTLWTATLLGVLVFPLLGPFLPTIPLVRSVPQTPESIVAEPVPLPASERPEMPAPFFASNIHDSEIRDVKNEHAVTSVVASSVSVEPSVEFEKNAAISWSGIIVSLWGLGALFFVTRLIASLAAMKTLARQSGEERDPETLRLVEIYRAKFGVARPVRVLRSEAVLVPFASGIFRPIIFLPYDSGNADPHALRWILMHEMVHLSRKDTLWQLLAQVARITYWFHPLLGPVCKRLRTERELACDQAVLEAENRPEQYASVLLDLSESVRSSRSFFPACVVAMASTPPMERRIREILDFRANRPTRRFGSVTIIVAVLLTTAIAAALTPMQTQQVASEPVRETPEKFVAENSDGSDKSEISVPIHVDLPENVKANEIYIGGVEMTDSSSSGLREINYGDHGFASKPSMSFRPDSMYVVWAYMKDGTLVSDFVTLSDPVGATLEFKLFQGVPLSGTIKSGDGKPMSEVKVNIFRWIPCDNQDGTTRNLPFHQSLKTDRNGKYSIHLPPGEYELSSVASPGWEIATVSLKNGDDKVVDFTTRNVFYVRLLDGEGRSVFENESKHDVRAFRWQQESPGEGRAGGGYRVSAEMDIDEDGNVRFFAYNKFNILCLLSQDGKEGLLRKFPNSVKNGEIIEARLEPSAKVKFRLMNQETKKPIANTLLRCPMRLFIPGDTPSMLMEPANSWVRFNADYTSDENGYVTAFVPALGEYAKTDSLKYDVNIADGNSWCIVAPLKMPFTVERSGEEIDLGNIEVLPAGNENTASTSKKANVPEKLGMFPVEKDGKTQWTIRGRVLYPDGSPAKNVQLYYTYDFGNYLNATDELGYFTENRGVKSPEIKSVPKPTFNMCGVTPGKESDAPWSWAMPLTVIENSEKQPPEKFIFRLQKACPVVVDVRFEGDFVPRFGGVTFRKNDPSFGDYQFETIRDKTSFFRAALLPGQYDFFRSDTPWKAGETSVTITEEDVTKTEPKKIELHVPAPAKIKVQGNTEPVPSLSSIMVITLGTIDEDGKRRGMSNIYSSVSGQDSEGNFVAQFSPYFNFINFDGENETGFLCIQDANTAGKTYVLHVKPYASGKIRLLSRETGKPIVGANVEYDYPFRFENAIQYTGRQTTVKTGSDGVIEIKKMVPEAVYRLKVMELIKQKDDETPRRPSVEQTFTAEKPGEEHDFGDVYLDGDFFAFQGNL